LLAFICSTSSVLFSQTKPKPAPAKTSTKFGALAVDRSNGFYYGWANDWNTRAEAEKKALDECVKRGGNCTVVLTFSGEACAAYRTIASNVGTAYGWGIGKTKEQADSIATSECLKRSSGQPATNYVWSCNSKKSGPIKEIYNASDEIEAPVKIGSQTWMNRNLDVDRFRNGDPIPYAKNWEELKQYSKNAQPAYCYLNFDTANGKKYGKLYNFYAVMDKRGLAPAGWHVPSKAEWEQLINFLGGEYEAGVKMRSTKGWDIKDKYGFAPGNGNNSSGLNLLPGQRGWDSEYASKKEDVFPGTSISDGAWYSSTVDKTTTFNGFTLRFGTRNSTGLSSEYPTRMFSVRVLKN
jgi:uncharacterized protein (TIGR02145 family)